MTDRTVDPDSPFFMTAEAPTHLERGFTPQHGHGFHRAVTGLTRKARLDVTHMRKMNMVREIMNPNPRNRSLRLPIADQLLHTRPVLPHHRHAARNVAASTHLYRGDASIDGTIRGRVAVHTGNLIGTGMKLVRKRNGLIGTSAGTERTPHDCDNRDRSDRQCCHDPEAQPLRSTHHTTLGMSIPHYPMALRAPVYGPFTACARSINMPPSGVTFRGLERFAVVPSTNCIHGKRGW
jgi:hypothetical protein